MKKRWGWAGEKFETPEAAVAAMASSYPNIVAPLIDRANRQPVPGAAAAMMARVLACQVVAATPSPTFPSFTDAAGEAHWGIPA